MLCFVLIGTCSFAQFEWAVYGNSVKKYVLTHEKEHVLLLDSFFISADSFGGFLTQEPYPEDIDSLKVIDIEQLDDSTFIYIIKAILQNETFYYGYRYDDVNLNTGLSAFVFNPALFFNYCSEKIHIKSFGNDEFLMFSEGENTISCPATLSKFSINGGSEIWKKKYDGFVFRDLAVSSDQIYVCTQNGFLVLNSEGELIVQFQDQIYDRVLPINDSYFLVQKANTLIRISTSVEPLDTAVITAGQIMDFDVHFGKIGVLTTTNQYLIFDEALNEITNFQLNTPNLEYTKTKIGNDEIFLAGSNGYGADNYRSDAVFVKAYTFDGTDNAPKKDIGIINIGHGEQVDVINQGSHYAVVYDSLIISIKNFGESNITKLALNKSYYALATPGIFQSTGYIYLNNIFPPIELGETREVVWNNYVRNSNQDPAGQLLDICLWASLPNNGIDIDSTNDVGCASFLVDTKITVQILAQIEVFPNPATTYVNLSRETPSVNKSVVSLVDQMGRVVRQQALPLGWQTESLETNGLASGLYFWQLVEEGKQVAAGKLIVQR